MSIPLVPTTRLPPLSNTGPSSDKTRPGCSMLGRPESKQKRVTVTASAAIEPTSSRLWERETSRLHHIASSQPPSGWEHDGTTGVIIPPAVSRVHGGQIGFSGKRKKLSDIRPTLETGKGVTEFWESSAALRPRAPAIGRASGKACGAVGCNTATFSLRVHWTQKRGGRLYRPASASEIVRLGLTSRAFSASAGHAQRWAGK